MCDREVSCALHAADRRNQSKHDVLRVHLCGLGVGGTAGCVQRRGSKCVHKHKSTHTPALWALLQANPVAKQGC